MAKHDPIVIADSSALFSLLIKSDRNHSRATSLSKKLLKTRGLLILAGEIFAEVVNILGKKAGKELAVRSAETLLSTDIFTFVESTALIRTHAFEIYKQQPASVSFTDCVVMAFADEYKTKLIFGFDEAFRKSGYLRIGIDGKKT